MSKETKELTLQDIQEAYKRIRPNIKRTLIDYSFNISEQLGCNLYLKLEMLQRCKAFIDEHFTENLSVEELSKIANMSVSGFAHHFKKVLGLSPVQYLIRLKIGTAQKLLITTDKNITEIGMDVGYESVSHFNNQFKKFVGTSPQNYRKLWLGNEQFQNLNHIYNELQKR